MSVQTKAVERQSNELARTQTEDIPRSCQMENYLMIHMKQRRSDANDLVGLSSLCAFLRWLAAIGSTSLSVTFPFITFSHHKKKIYNLLVRRNNNEPRIRSSRGAIILENRYF